MELSSQLDGSVDEDYTQSDEEYDDLAMLDIQEYGYSTDDDDKDIYNKFESNKKTILLSGDQLPDESYEIEEQKYKQNTDHFRSKSEMLFESPPDFYSSFLGEKNEKKVSVFATHGQYGAFTNVYSFSEAIPR